MDTLYIGDIPLEFHYAQFGSNYVDLYNHQTLSGNEQYYRIYLYDNYFNYDTGTRSYSYNTGYAKDIPVSNEPIYRRDFPSIVFVVFIFAIFGIWLTNIVTSFIKKGGLLGGLL